MRSSAKAFLFENWAMPGLFFIYFRLFKQTLQFLQQIYVKIPSSNVVMELNPQPSDYEFPPLTTGPVPLPPTYLFNKNVYWFSRKQMAS